MSHMNKRSIVLVIIWLVCGASSTLASETKIIAAESTVINFMDSIKACDATAAVKHLSHSYLLRDKDFTIRMLDNIKEPWARSFLTPWGIVSDSKELRDMPPYELYVIKNQYLFDNIVKCVNSNNSLGIEQQNASIMNSYIDKKNRAYVLAQITKPDAANAISVAYELEYDQGLWKIIKFNPNYMKGPQY